MMSQRPFMVEILAAAAVSMTLAPGVLALSPHTTSQHDESEAAEPRPTASSDNPYDEPIPATRLGLAKVLVPAQDGMLRLPGGRVVIGSANPKAPANEHPARSVAVAPFWIDRTEVTVAAYRACVGAGACLRPARASTTCTFDADDGELPVSCVHWSDADAYCRFAKKRLPTEVEWEFAARGSLAVPFPWGGAASCSNAVTLVSERTGRSCAPSGPTRVGSHPGGDSLFGVQDLSGNVEEWTADWYTESLGPGETPRSGAAHVLRGGGWLSPPSLSRTTSRDWGSAVESGPNIGFRCARSD
jgi:serine/threonine-protein kinase